ncbi:MAG: hypothetical protein LBJ84_03030, partial [Oscillospiraceae bacterium]|nr:hypothetical protein [Oscillospiraceae bacterium]
MDKRTRVKSAMDCLPVDHAPVGFWVHFFDKGIFGDACVKAHLDYYNALDLDFVKVMSDGYFGFPNGLKIESVDDLYRMKPIEADHPWITDQVERAAAIVDKLGGERMIFFNIFNPFSSLKYGFTEDLIHCDEIIMQFVREDKNAVKRALDIVVAGNALLCELLVKKAGCDGIYYCVQNAETDRFTKA